MSERHLLGTWRMVAAFLAFTALVGLTGCSLAETVSSESEGQPEREQPQELTEETRAVVQDERVEDLQTELKTVRQRLEDDLEVTRQELTRAEEEVEQRNQRIAELESELEALQTERAELQDAVEEARAEAEQAQVEQVQQVEEDPAPGEGTEVATAVVDINGTPGVAFECFLSSMGSSRTVEGTIPASFEVQYETGFLSFDYINASCSKAFSFEPQAGTLTVSIVANGQVMNAAETSSEFGTASASWDTVE